MVDTPVNPETSDGTVNAAGTLRSLTHSPCAANQYSIKPV